MSSIKISVIVPVFNKQQYLKECLDSLISQSLKDIEIICVDDGSTDNSPSIIEEYSNTDKRIRTFSQENSGPGSARNRGLKESVGEYVAFIDADDWIEEDALEKTYDDAIVNESDLVLFNALEHLPENVTKARVYYPESIEGSFNYTEHPDLIMNNYQIVCTKIHRRTFLEENDIHFDENGLFEDVFFHVKSIVKSCRISYINEFLYNYRRIDLNTRQFNSIRSKKCVTFLDISNAVQSLLIDEVIYDSYEENFFKFKVTEIRNLFNNINDDYKNDFYHLIRDDFNKNPIQKNVLIKLPMDLQKFYLSIINSGNLREYDDLLNDNNKNTTLGGTLKAFIRKFI